MASFEDPLKGIAVEKALSNLIVFLLGFVGLLTILGIIVGGMYIITGLGNQSQVEKGKKMIFWSIVGMVVVALAVVIIGIISSALGIRGAPL